jgi:hypothetical protein
MTVTDPLAAVCLLTGSGPDGGLTPDEERSVCEILRVTGWRAPWGPAPAWAADCSGLVHWLPGPVESLGSVALGLVKVVLGSCPGVQMVIIDPSGRSWLTPRSKTAFAPVRPLACP